MIHLKKTNSEYGYKGIQPQYVAACQLPLLNKEVAPEKLKLQPAKVFAGVYMTNPAECCPICVAKAGLNVTRENNQQFYDNLLIDTFGTLVGMLYANTNDLYFTFLDMARASAERLFEFYQGIIALSYDELVAKYPQAYKSRFDKKQSVILSKKGCQVRDAARAAARIGLDAFVLKAVDDARKHYTQSTEKLASRLEAKGLGNFENVRISSERIDRAGNIEIRIDFDGGVVRAWTIIASGPIIAPHYRYLIK